MFKKTKKLLNVKKLPKFKIFSLRIHKGAEIKKTETIINNGTKHKKNYMKGLNSKNKNVKDDGSP